MKLDWKSIMFRQQNLQTFGNKVTDFSIIHWSKEEVPKEN
jgi:hypothetical protein